MQTEQGVSGEQLSPELLATEVRLQALSMRQTLPPEAYVLTPAERMRADELTKRGRHLPPRRPFLAAEIVSAGAAARGSWQRQRGTSRAQRPQVRRSSRLVASREGPSRSTDDPPLARLPGFAAASARMVEHLERRRAAIRIARMA